jgi:hypothetical protein
VHYVCRVFEESFGTGTTGIALPQESFTYAHMEIEGARWTTASHFYRVKADE